MDPAVSAPDAVWPDEELVDFYGVPYKKTVCTEISISTWCVESLVISN